MVLRKWRETACMRSKVLMSRLLKICSKSAAVPKHLSLADGRVDVGVLVVAELPAIVGAIAGVAKVGFERA